MRFFWTALVLLTIAVPPAWAESVGDPASFYDVPDVPDNADTSSGPDYTGVDIYGCSSDSSCPDGYYCGPAGICVEFDQGCITGSCPDGYYCDLSMEQCLPEVNNPDPGPEPPPETELEPVPQPEPQPVSELSPETAPEPAPELSPDPATDAGGVPRLPDPGPRSDGGGNSSVEPAPAFGNPEEDASGCATAPDPTALPLLLTLALLLMAWRRRLQLPG